VLGELITLVSIGSREQHKSALTTIFTYLNPEENIGILHALIRLICIRILLGLTRLDSLQP
jgi:uncharacterized membrane protein